MAAKYLYSGLCHFELDLFQYKFDHTINSHDRSLVFHDLYNIRSLSEMVGNIQSESPVSHYRAWIRLKVTVKALSETKCECWVESAKAIHCQKALNSLCLWSYGMIFYLRHSSGGTCSWPCRRYMD